MAAARLRPSSAFEMVFREGSVIGGPLLAFRFRPNDTTVSRWGYAVGKKLDRRSSRRNHLRRRLRAIAATLDAPPGLDIVILARNGAMEATYLQLEARARNLAARLPVPQKQTAPE